jgi:hypothetical protein
MLLAAKSRDRRAENLVPFYTKEGASERNKSLDARLKHLKTFKVFNPSAKE